MNIQRHTYPQIHTYSPIPFGANQITRVKLNTGVCFAFFNDKHDMTYQIRTTPVDVPEKVVRGIRLPAGVVFTVDIYTKQGNLMRRQPNYRLGLPGGKNDAIKIIPTPDFVLA